MCSIPHRLLYFFDGPAAQPCCTFSHISPLPRASSGLELAYLQYPKKIIILPQSRHLPIRVRGRSPLYSIAPRIPPGQEVGQRDMGKGGQVETEEGRKSLERVRGLRYEGCVSKKSKWLEVAIQVGLKWDPIRVTWATRGSMWYTSGLNLASGWSKLTRSLPQFS